MTKSNQTTISAVSLLVANVLPLFGVLFWGWSLGWLLALYWAESAVIGLFNVLKILMIAPLQGIPLALFFVFHFGGFMLGHALFLGILIEDASLGDGPGAIFGMVAAVRWELLALLFSHGISFVVHWVLGDESEGRTLPRQMIAPYGRIIVMHLSILAGAFAVEVLGQPAWMLALFVLLKVSVDVFAHLREHRGAEQ